LGHEFKVAPACDRIKLGGLATAKATIVGLPMVPLRPIPGQEERNATDPLFNFQKVESLST
jgi:hypothetical protein